MDRVSQCYILFIQLTIVHTVIPQSVPQCFLWPGPTKISIMAVRPYKKSAINGRAQPAKPSNIIQAGQPKAGDVNYYRLCATWSGERTRAFTAILLCAAD